MHQHHWDQPESLPSAFFTLKVCHLPRSVPLLENHSETLPQPSAKEVRTRFQHGNSLQEPLGQIDLVQLFPTSFRNPKWDRAQRCFPCGSVTGPRHKLDSARSPLMQSDRHKHCFQQCSARVRRASLVDDELLRPGRNVVSWTLLGTCGSSTMWSTVLCN